MNTKRIEKNARRVMYFAIIVGVLLLASGVVIAQLGLYPMINGKSLIALSLLPFAVATVYLTKLLRIKNSTQTMRSTLIKEHDERIVAQKNEVDAKTLKIVQGALFISYMSYSAIVPEHIFESVGWWIVLIILMLSFIAQVILSKKIKGSVDSEN